MSCIIFLFFGCVVHFAILSQMYHKIFHFHFGLKIVILLFLLFTDCTYCISVYIFYYFINIFIYLYGTVFIVILYLIYIYYRRVFYHITVHHSFIILYPGNTFLLYRTLILNTLYYFFMIFLIVVLVCTETPEYKFCEKHAIQKQGLLRSIGTLRDFDDKVIRS